MPSGGYRKGAGRKSVASEEKTRELCKAAITSKFGTPEAGLKMLIESGEPALIKWVFEHAFGKPVEEVDVTSNGETINQPQEVIIRDYSKKN